MKKPDWSKSPEGATHWNGDACFHPWLKDNPPSYLGIDEEWVEYKHDDLASRHLSQAIARPPKKQKKHERIAELLKGKTISWLTIGEARELGGYLADGTNLIVDTSENKK